jgi:imidazolonepropionase-like amidohydrolase
MSFDRRHFPMRRSTLVLALCLSACTTPPGSDDEVGEAEAGDGDGDVVECGALSPAPDGSTCTAEGAAGGSLLVRGDVLAGDTVYRGGSLRIAGDMITCVGCECEAADATITCADAVVSPGLINTHDHITFANNWPIGEGVDRYEHRHDWREGLNGHDALDTQGGASDETVLAAELRFVMGGATSAASAGGQPGLLRNLDSGDLQGLSLGQVDSDTFPLDDADGTQRASGCDYGPDPTSSGDIQNDAYLPHIAEGINLYASNELTCSDANGIVATNTAIVHALGVPLALAQTIADAGSSVIWSPRSNVVLYGATAPVTMYDALGVPLALGTDWLASGSMNMLRELACADYLDTNYYGDYFSDRALWAMATGNAAAAVGGDMAIGTLEVGYVADVAIFAKAGEQDHGAVVRGSEAEVALVLRGGEALYGDAALLASDALGRGTCELVEVCGADKRACVQLDTGTSFAAVEAAAGYPLFFCGTPVDEPSCIPTRDEYEGIDDQDQDGDGIPDANDNCPSVFNPVFEVPFPLWDEQPDSDLDGLGDVCDPCPWNEGDTCEGPDPDDLDGDGVPADQDNCPDVANADQADADDDGKGDACDDCAVANPGNQACPATVEQIQDTSNPDHVPPGATVLVEGLIVTALREDGSGFAAETGTGMPFTGIYVFTQGIAADVAIGDTVDVQGTIEEFFDLTELTGATIVSQTPGDGTLPFMPTLVLPSEVASGGAMAEARESMLLRIENVAISNPNPDGPEDFDEFELDGLRVDDFLFDALDNMCAVDSTFTAVQGVLTYSFGDFKLAPRSAADFEGGSCMPF